MEEKELMEKIFNKEVIDLVEKAKNNEETKDFLTGTIVDYIEADVALEHVRRYGITDPIQIIKIILKKEE